jgi:hypothetical protein
MNELTTRTADVIAAEINGIKAQTRTVLLCGSIEIGRRLTEAKDMIDHGKWGKWLEKSVDYSQSTANNLMRIFNEYGADQIPLFGDNSKSQALGNLSYTQAVALLGVPAEEREAFIEKNDAAAMSTRELQQAIKDRDDALARAVAAEKSAEEADKVRETVQSTLDVTKKAIQNASKEIDNLKRERHQAQEEIDGLNKKLVEARAAGESDEKITELTGALDEAHEQVRQLTEQLAKPVTVEATVVERPAAAAILKYGVHFEVLVTGFKNLLGTLGEIKEADPAEYEKYKNAVTGLLGKMSERL